MQILVNYLDKHQSLDDAFSKPYDQQAQLGQPLLISVKTLPNTASK